jgi:hypothetical protein
MIWKECPANGGEGKDVGRQGNNARGKKSANALDSHAHLRRMLGDDRHDRAGHETTA